MHLKGLNMLFDAPVKTKMLGTVKILRTIQVDKSNMLAVAKALGMDPMIKGMSAGTIYVVQEAPAVSGGPVPPSDQGQQSS